MARHINHAEARGEDLHLAIALGSEPVITLMAATPMLYDQLEYKMAAVMQGKPYRVVKTAKGLDVPWGAEYDVLEGRLLSRQREPEGPFGEFPGYYSGVHNYPVIEIDRISHRKDPIYDSVYVGRPWTELDYLQAMTTCVPDLADNLLDPSGQPSGMVHKMIIDATTPVAPDIRGDFGEELDQPPTTAEWRDKLAACRT